MSLSCFFSPHHGSSLHANGHGEVWTDWNSTSKFSQYGWRCTTNEDSYSNKTLLGNWNQERYDIRRVLQPRPLPSQFSHYFESTYSSDHSKEMPHSTRNSSQGQIPFPFSLIPEKSKSEADARFAGANLRMSKINDCPHTYLLCCGPHLRNGLPEEVREAPALLAFHKLGVTRQPHWFPGHQPELEPPPIKRTARSCYMIDYEPPRGKGPALVEKPKEPEETQPKQ